MIYSYTETYFRFLVDRAILRQIGGLIIGAGLFWLAVFSGAWGFVAFCLGCGLLSALAWMLLNWLLVGRHPHKTVDELCAEMREARERAQGIAHAPMALAPAKPISRIITGLTAGPGDRLTPLGR